MDVLTIMERDSLIYVWRAPLSKLVILNKEAPHIYSPRPNATQRTGRIQERKILPRTHIHPTTDSRSIPVQWKTPCYVNFIDFENAFNSIHRESLWCILRHYGIPCKIVTIIKMLYEGFKTKMIYGQHLTEEFDIKTGVKHGCILSPFPFCLAIDWIMKRTDICVKSGIIWTFTESLGDLDFADGVSLLAHSHRDIQSKNEKLVRSAAKVGLHVNKVKNQNNAKQLSNSRPSQTQRTRHRRRNTVHIPGSESDKIWKHRG